MSVDRSTGVTDSPATRLQTLFEGHRLTPTQRRIAHSMVRRAADVPFLSSVELADLAGVSQPSVTRFAVALGFDGYPALRRHLREVVPAEPAAGPGSYNEYQQAVEAEIENLRHLAEVLADPRPVQKAGRILAASRPLPVLGLRAAASQAYGFAYFAAKVHPDVRLLDQGGTMVQDRIDAAVRAGASALLCFALPRHPREVVDTLAYAKECGLTVVAVADSAFAPVAKHSDRAACAAGARPRRRSAGRPSPGRSRPAPARTPRRVPCGPAKWRRVPSSGRRPALPFPSYGPR